MSSPPPEPMAPPAARRGLAQRIRRGFGALIAQVRALWRRVLALSRRMRTLLVSAVLFVALLAVSLSVHVPYVVLSPGPTYNTLGTYDADNQSLEIIKITGTKVNKVDGNLNLTTVEFSNPGQLTIFNALSAWLQSDQVVVPESYVYPPGSSQQQVNQQNTADFTESQNSAVVAASCLLGYPKRFGILTVTPGGPSATSLHAEDGLLSVAGSSVNSYDALKAVLARQHEGDVVPVVVSRDGRQRTFKITLGPPDEGGTGATLGIGVTPTPQCLPPFEIDLGLGDTIGGPSAGLMFTLGIIDKVGDPSKYDLTQGRFIAGTGTIDADGNVGPIGGIQLKMIAARDHGATIFLAPAGNCDEVRGDTPAGLQVVKVSTLNEAVTDLQTPASQAGSLPGC